MLMARIQSGKRLKILEGKVTDSVGFLSNERGLNLSQLWGCREEVRFFCLFVFNGRKYEKLDVNKARLVSFVAGGYNTLFFKK